MPPRTPPTILAFWLVVGLLIMLLAGRPLLDPERVATETGAVLSLSKETLFPIAFVLFGGTLVVLSVARWLRNPPAAPPPGKRKNPKQHARK